MANPAPLRWHFDGWAIARGSVRAEPPLTLGYRILVVGGWAALFGLIFVAYVTDVGSLFTVGLAVFLATWVGGKALRTRQIGRWREGQRRSRRQSFG